jgi:hypothetical protein
MSYTDLSITGVGEVEGMSMWNKKWTNIRTVLVVR